MSQIDELLSAIPLDQLASLLGVSEDEAATASRQAVPALLDGLAANAQDPAGAASIDAALQQHQGGLLDSTPDLGSLDLSDGAKIVEHIFGSNSGQVANQLGGLGGGGDLFGKLLPMLAPLVMSFLSGKRSGASNAQQSGDGGGLTDLLGGLLGGGGGGGGGLGDILGGLLGGGTR